MNNWGQNTDINNGRMAVTKGVIYGTGTRKCI